MQQSLLLMGDALKLQRDYRDWRLLGTNPLFPVSLVLMHDADVGAGHSLYVGITPLGKAAAFGAKSSLSRSISPQESAALSNCIFCQDPNVDLQGK